MRITELRAENVKRLHAVEIKPDGSTVVIGGRNGQGKSSVLDSIFWALGGAGNMPGKPVRDGEAEASITIRLDASPNLIVTRKIKADGKTTLEIRQVDENGVTMKVSSPQKLLDSLCSAVAFDPLAFTRLRPQQQAETLRALIGLDFADLDAAEKEAFDNRTAESRELKAMQARYEVMPQFADAPAEEIAINDLVKKLDMAQAANRAKLAQQESAKAIEQAIANDAMHAKQILGQIAELQRKLKQVEAEREGHEAAYKTAKEKADAMPGIECDPIREQISKADEQNAQFRANAARAELGKSVAKRAQEVEQPTKQVEGYRAQKTQRLAEADWPVDGLGFAADGVTFNNLPFEQCSSAEKLRISTAIGFAQNPKLKVLLIHDGSLLDDESLAEVARLAEAHDGQVWIERVGDGAECSVVIEDGSIRGAVAEPKPELAAV